MKRFRLIKEKQFIDNFWRAHRINGRQKTAQNRYRNDKNQEVPESQVVERQDAENTTPVTVSTDVNDLWPFY